MLQLFGPKEIILNVARVVRSHNPTAPIHDAESLRHGFLAFLSERQGQHVEHRDLEDMFVLDNRSEHALSSAFKKGALNDLNQADLIGEAYDDQTRIEKTKIARQALTSTLTADETFCFIFGLVIHSVFVRPSKPAPGIRGSHGGSSSAAIGSIWLTVGEQVTQRDLMEMYVHELAHHLLFIDELNSPQFNYDEIVKRENFALSAVLKKQRPLDKVVHSIVVAAEILLSRQRFLPSHEATAIHPPTRQLARDTLASIESVESLPNVRDLVTEHLRSVMQQCRAACEHVAGAESIA